MLYYSMLNNHPNQSEFEFVCLEQLVPQDHLLRKIEHALDFEFIREKVRPLYCENNGRPSVDPVVFFKILFIGYLYGIRSERQLIREVEMNMGYRWFLGYNLTEKIPSHSTLSQNRRRRFSESNVYQEIFDHVVLAALELGLADGKTLYTDSTHLKADANKKQFELSEMQKSTRGYLEDLEADVNCDRAEHGKRELKKKVETVETKETKVSTTDPESGYMVRDGKPEGFFYLDHRTVDGKFNIITDSCVTAGNVHDATPYLERLDRQKERFNFAVEAVGLDAGYLCNAICKGLSERKIFGVIGDRRWARPAEHMSKHDYVYDSESDSYLCPGNGTLTYRNTTRDGYREYVSDPSLCIHCTWRSLCTQSKNCKKVITRHIWEDYKEEIIRNRRSPRGKEIYARRKETVERSFADAKQLHGHRYARFRGLKKVQEQCLLAAACQNMKKIALAIA